MAAVFGPSLFTNWRFFTKLWALFHPKHLVTLTRDCSKVEVMLINAFYCFRIVRRREELHPDLVDLGHVGRHPAAVQVSFCRQGFKSLLLSAINFFIPLRVTYQGMNSSTIRPSFIWSRNTYCARQGSNPSEDFYKTRIRQFFVSRFGLLHIFNQHS